MTKLVKSEGGPDPDAVRIFIGSIDQGRQGKCERCECAYLWPAKLMMLRDAYCPTCGSKLSQTTHLYRRGPWKVIPEPLNSTQAVRRRGEFTYGKVREREAKRKRGAK